MSNAMDTFRALQGSSTSASSDELPGGATIGISIGALSVAVMIVAFLAMKYGDRHRTTSNPFEDEES